MKKLNELTIKDNWMFGAVMLQDDNCRQFLERLLGFQIESLTIDLEKNIIYHPEYKGIRLDVIANDADRTRYNLEMQVLSKDSLPRRVRYYSSEMDMDLLISGTAYEQLSESYVIFICDFDPFRQKKYCYRFQMRTQEGLEMQDGSHAIFLSTMGQDADNVPEALVKFLKFVKANPEESQKDFGDSYVEKLQRDIQKIKVSREMGQRYMMFDELIAEEKEESRKEGILLGEESKLKKLIQKKLVKGLSIPEIAEHLEEDEETVRKYIEEIGTGNEL